MYKITYKTNGGSGEITVEEGRLDGTIILLEKSGCFDIVVEQFHEEDPCDFCKCNRCADCQYGG